MCGFVVRFESLKELLKDRLYIENEFFASILVLVSPQSSELIEEKLYLEKSRICWLVAT